MRWQVWPLAQIDGKWNIEDEILLLVWAKMVEEDKVKTVFYQGSVKTPEGWLRFCHDPYNQVCLLLDLVRARIAGVAWINSFANGITWAHFCVFGRVSIEGCKEVVKYWSLFQNGDGKPLFKAILGLTPEPYKTAHKFVKKLGFTEVGYIPNICNMIYHGKREGARLFYYCPEEVPNGR